MNNQEWRWDGGVLSFVEIVQWAFVFHKLGEEGTPGFMDTMSSPEIVRLKAEEYGMTLRTVTKEMLRIGKDAQALFKAIDEEQRKEEREKI